MSVTISIVGNFEYVNANCPELIKVTVYDKDIDPEQHEFKDYPFEMNLANGNFVALWDALHLNADDCCGTIDPQIVLNRLNSLKLNSLTIDGYREGGNGSCMFISCGRSLEQVTRYYWNLRQICTEAKKRGVFIQWC